MEALVKIEELDLFKKEVAKIRSLSEGIVVQSIDDTIPMELAKTLLKQTKVALKKIEDKRKELKEDSLRTGQRIDEVARRMREDLTGVAVDLQSKVDYEKIWKEERLVKLFEIRSQLIKANGIGTEFTLGKEFTKDHGFMQLSVQEFDEFIEDSVSKKLAEARRQEALANRMLVAGELHDFMTVDIAQCTDEEFSNDLKAAHERKLDRDNEEEFAQRARLLIKYSDALPRDLSFVNNMSDAEFNDAIELAKTIQDSFDTFRTRIEYACKGDTDLYPAEYNYRAYDFYQEYHEGDDFIKEFEEQLRRIAKSKYRIEQAEKVTKNFDFYEMPIGSTPGDDEEYIQWIKDLQGRVGKQLNRAWIISSINGSTTTDIKLWKWSDEVFNSYVEKEKSIANTIRTEKRIKQINELKEVVRIETSIENLRTMTDAEWDLFINERVAEKKNMEEASQYEKAIDYFKRLREVEIPEFTHPGLVANIKIMIGKMEKYTYEKTKV